MITYEFTKIAPQQMHLQIKYSKADKPDYYVNLTISDFSEETLHQQAKNNAKRAEVFYNTTEQLPESIDVSENTGVVKPYIETPAPAFDSATQKLVSGWVESDDAFTQIWTTVAKSADELAEELEKWRSGTSVSMRQARLALADQGLLQGVEDAIALIPEPDKSKVTVEWEYASTVERMSPWVAALQPVLGLTDEQMDNLFKLAASL